MTTRRDILRYSIATTTALAGATTAFASVGGAIDSAADAKRKINIAGRQRMLTQRMAKAACFAFLGV
ncbi:MAG: type IV pili methyl-accepting chemotaxis transducer N-terminal domain-containing protein, partial [Pseudomonadota bacterium]